MTEYGLTIGGFQGFRRLHFRLIHGYWCDHLPEPPGQIIDWRKGYRCYYCGHLTIR